MFYLDFRFEFAKMIKKTRKLTNTLRVAKTEKVISIVKFFFEGVCCSVIESKRMDSLALKFIMGLEFIVVSNKLVN